jgi:uncharacterized protein (DUF433 family)
MAEVILDRKIRHGKPIIKGTRITVDEVLTMLENGMTYEEIKREYGLTKEDVRAALKYAALLVRDEEVQQLHEAVS